MDDLVKCSDTLARAVLLALCSEQEIELKAIEYLKNLTAAAGANIVRAAGAKRKANNLEICSQCNQAFSEDLNYSDSCRYHDGELEPDYEGDFWADHDERCHGTIDSEFCRSEYPEGFIWSCCEKSGDNTFGCTVAKHLGSTRLLKRIRGEKSSDGAKEDEDGDDVGDEDQDGEEDEGSVSELEESIEESEDEE